MDFDLSGTDVLTASIETDVGAFIKDIEGVLS
jgi:hypothetical protein